MTSDLAERLVDSYARPPAPALYDVRWPLPELGEVVECFRIARSLLFPGYLGGPPAGSPEDVVRAYVGTSLDELRQRLERQVFLGLYHRAREENNEKDVDAKAAHDEARAITGRFLEALPCVRDALLLDVSAHYDGDPAARATDEVVFCYPGFFAMTAFRLAHRLLAEGAAIIPRMLTEHAHERTGIDIHPGAIIGRSLFIDHGTGIVVGETTRIGDRVRIYQGVTLGALSVKRAHERHVQTVQRHPTIEDDVILYANATILGGDTVIGRGAVIGGNCWVTSSVPAGARVTVDGGALGPR